MTPATDAYDAYTAKLVQIAKEYERGLMTSQDLADRILSVTVAYMKTPLGR
jgi:hypothetical protein